MAEWLFGAAGDSATSSSRRRGGGGGGNDARAIRRLPLQSWTAASQRQRHRTTFQPLAGALQPLHVEAAATQPGFSSSHSGAATAQATLLLGGCAADVAVRLPPGLRIGATRRGALDVTVELLSVHADWPARRGYDGTTTAPRLLPARSPAAGFACRAVALCTLNAMFPDQAPALLAALSVPVAVADVAASFAPLVPRSALHAMASIFGDDEEVEEDDGRDGKCSSSAQTTTKTTRRRRRRQQHWARNAVGASQAAVHTLRALSAPAATLATAAYAWSLLHPSSFALVQATVALMAVSASYNAVGRDAAAGRVARGRPLEAAWRAAHRRAARRIARHLHDGPRGAPPLQRAFDAFDRLSIAAGVLVDGAPLLGGGWGGGGSGGSGTCRTLALAASFESVHASARAIELDPCTGLERSQLLQLFASSSVGDERPAAALHVPPCQPSCSRADAESPFAARSAPPPRRRWWALRRRAASRGKGRGDDESGGAVCIAVHAVSGAAAASTATPASPRSGGGSEISSGGGSGALGTATQASALALAQQGGAPLSTAPDPLAILRELTLYGRADHAADGLAAAAAAQRDGTGALLRARLTVRALQLLVIFLPFLMLGLPLLFASAWLMARASALAGGDGDVSVEDASEAASEGESERVGAAPPPRFSTPPPPTTTPTATVPLLAALQRALVTASACLDLVLILLIGGGWRAGVGAWESAALSLRRASWRLLLASCAASGAAFIKWGQWSATRPDMFPEDFCDVLSALHDRAPVHGWRATRAAVEASLPKGQRLEDVFSTFECAPRASGSIAQVHIATLRRPQSQLGLAGGATTATTMPTPVAVAVKVRHPGVEARIAADFRLLAALARRLPAALLRGFDLEASVQQFSHTMTAQADLRVEAVHLLRFQRNFARVASRIAVPAPAPRFASPGVLVESYERGESVAAYMRSSSSGGGGGGGGGGGAGGGGGGAGGMNTQIVALGVDAYLKMLLLDNFVHTDLHPGNILVRDVSPAGVAAAAAATDGLPPPQQWRRRHREEHEAALARAAAAAAAPGGDWEAQLEAQINAQKAAWQRKLDDAAAAAAAAAASAAAAKAATAAAAGEDDGATTDVTPAQPQQQHQPVAQIVLIDFGLAEELTPDVRLRFIGVLCAIGRGDGLRAAHHLLRWSAEPQPASVDAPAFRRAVAELFDEACDVRAPRGIDLDVVLKALLRLAREHRVRVDSAYAALVVGLCVIVGFATALDPGVNLMDAAIPCLLAHSLTGRVMGRLYS